MNRDAFEVWWSAHMLICKFVHQTRARQDWRNGTLCRITAKMPRCIQFGAPFSCTGRSQVSSKVILEWWGRRRLSWSRAFVHTVLALSFAFSHCCFVRHPPAIFGHVANTTAHEASRSVHRCCSFHTVQASISMSFGFLLLLGVIVTLA